MANYSPSKKPEEASSGALVGTVIIILVLISGAIVVFYNQYQKSKAWQEIYQADQTTELAQPKDLVPISTSTSTNIAEIEADLQKADLDTLQTDVDSLNLDNL